MRNAIITALLVLGLAGIVPASAANTDIKDGFHIDLNLGWNKGSIKELVKNDDDKDDLNLGGSGFAYGGSVGYDHSISDNFFIGALVGLDGSSAKGCAGDKPKKNDKTFITVDKSRICQSFGRDFSIVGRTGWQDERQKIYVLAGYTNLKMSKTFPDVQWDDEANPKPDDFGKGLGRKHGGWRIGAGWQRSLNDSGSIFFKTEYRFSKYGGVKADKIDGKRPQDADGKNVLKNPGLTTHAIIAGVGFYF